LIEDQVNLIHAASLEILEKAGLLVHNEKTRSLRPPRLRVDEETLALDVLAKVSPGGSFMEDHSQKHMRTTALIPRIADREARTVWESKGSHI
jgi:trimethylamine--corrinoid protein Co-methyltransferase